MTINPKQVLKDFLGEEIKIEGKPLELKTVLVNALSYSEQELKATAEQSMRAYHLCMELMNKDSVELESEDIVFIKARMLKLYAPLVFGQVVSILEQKTTPLTEENKEWYAYAKQK